MKDKLKLGLNGEITIIADGNIIFKEKNSITSDATEVFLNLMANPTSGLHIDRIQFVNDDFSMIEKTITDRIIDLENNTVTYVTTSYEGELLGTLVELNLKMGTSLGLAIKTGLSIIKHEFMVIEVRWKIQINI